MATGGRVEGIVVKIVPGRPMTRLVSRTTLLALERLAPTILMSGGFIVPSMPVMKDSHVSSRYRSAGVLPYHVGKY
jgi:hypothetical protein